MAPDAVTTDVDTDETEPTTADLGVLEGDILVEEISIDGMCGVY